MIAPFEDNAIIGGSDRQWHALPPADGRVAHMRSQNSAICASFAPGFGFGVGRLVVVLEVMVDFDVVVVVGFLVVGRTVVVIRTGGCLDRGTTGGLVRAIVGLMVGNRCGDFTVVLKSAPRFLRKPSGNLVSFGRDLLETV